VGALFLLAIALGMGGGALAAPTPNGTWIRNTAQVEYRHPGSGLARDTTSNAADTQIPPAGPETDPPIIIDARATPNIVDNDGTQVFFTVQTTDLSGVKSVVIDLRPCGLLESTALRDDGVAPDIIAGDLIWTHRITVDSTYSGDTYRLPVTVTDSWGNRTTTIIQLTVRDLSPSFALIRSLGWNMRDDVRVSGDAVSLSVDRDPNLALVRFEYRRHSGGAWSLCETGVGSGPNPDTSGPTWGIYWNMSNLVADTYQLRAVGTRANGEVDPSPALLRIVLDRTDSWINEYHDTATGRHIRRQRYSDLLADTSLTIEGTSLAFGPAALPETIPVWLKLTVHPTAPSEAPAPLPWSGFYVPYGGTYRRFEREDGKTTFAAPVRITIPYDPTNLPVPEDQLAIYYYDLVVNAWRKVDGSIVDATRKTVSVEVSHFTDFAVFGHLTASPNLSQVLIFPNPFIPYDGDPNTGEPFIKGNERTGIVFRNLTSTVDIDIFTVAGRRVSTIRATNTGGWVQWDARTDDNKELASGMYIAVIKAPSGERVTKRFMVIR
jgi:hypothetical protein